MTVTISNKETFTYAHLVSIFKEASDKQKVLSTAIINTGHIYQINNTRTGGASALTCGKGENWVCWNNNKFYINHGFESIFTFIDRNAMTLSIDNLSKALPGDTYADYDNEHFAVVSVEESDSYGSNKKVISLSSDRHTLRVEFTNGALASSVTEVILPSTLIGTTTHGVLADDIVEINNRISTMHNNGYIMSYPPNLSFDTDSITLEGVTYIKESKLEKPKKIKIPIINDRPRSIEL